MVADIVRIPFLNGLGKASAFKTIYGWRELEHQLEAVRRAQPTVVHMAIAAWVRSHSAQQTKVLSLTTDDLLERCGLEVVYAKGSIREVFCALCQKARRDTTIVLNDSLPHCPLHPGTPLCPDHAVEERLRRRADDVSALSKQADLLVFIGVSGLDSTGFKIRSIFQQPERTIDINMPATLLGASYPINRPLVDVVPQFFALEA